MTAKNSITSIYASLKPCEIDNCSRISVILCQHCKKNVCQPHFFQHGEELLQELNPFANNINELGEEISSFSVEDYKEKLLEKLIRWRDEAIRSINDLFEQKKEELKLLVEDNEEIFLQRIECHTEALNILKNETAALNIDGDVTFEQLQILKKRLHALENSVSQTHNKVVYCDIKPLLIDNTLIFFHHSKNYYMQGGTLLCADHQMRLNDFYGNAKQKWELIYKATKDGFHAEDFHRCSDEKGPTMTIIQSLPDGYLFGGYTGISWGCDGKYKFDPAAFLFTLENPHAIQPTKFLQNQFGQNAVGHGKFCGPYFGGVIKDGKHFIDLMIYANANENQESYSSFPSTYNDTTGKGEILFTGAKNFMVKEIEVYKCLNETDGDED